MIASAKELQFEKRKAQLQSDYRSIDPRQQIRIEKRTTSNLFRYKESGNQRKKAISLKNFNHVLHIDSEAKTLNVEGLTTYETIIEATLPFGLIPTVTPELKHITIGGASVGIGIESTCYKYGFVHNGMIEAEVLLPSGDIVLCTPDNEYADLFHALPNSYGTLGYILRLKVQLIRAKPFVHQKIFKFLDVDSFLKAMESSAKDPKITFIESLFYSDKEFYLLLGEQVDKVPFVDDIYRKSIYYKLCSEREDIYLTTEDYLFRYDPDWFYNIPSIPFYSLIRRFSPKKWRHSGFYKKILEKKKKIISFFHLKNRVEDKEESLIQDWEVPLSKAKKLVEFAVKNIDLQGQPWMAILLKTDIKASIYPMNREEPLYFNLGFYGIIKKESKEPFHTTKMLDNKCFELGGIKMLYSSTFLTKEDFDRIYNGEVYDILKKKYDPQNRTLSLFEKVSLLD